MANKYWIDGTGTWSTSNTANWSLTSGGFGPAPVPTASDVAIFDANSNIAGGNLDYTCTRTATTAISGLQLNNPSAGSLTFDGTGAITISTSGLTIYSGVFYVATGNITISGTCTVSTNGVSIAAQIIMNTAGITVTLGSALTITNSNGLSLLQGTFFTNGYTVTLASFNSNATTARTFDITNSSVYVLNGSFSLNSLATAFTFVSTNSTIYFKFTTTTTKNIGIYGLTFNNIIISSTTTTLSCNFNSASGSTANILGSFQYISVTGNPISLNFTVGSIINFKSFIVLGQAGSLVVLRSSTTGVNFNFNGTILSSLTRTIIFCIFLGLFSSKYLFK